MRPAEDDEENEIKSTTRLYIMILSFVTIFSVFALLYVYTCIQVLSTPILSCK